jgi:DNA-binding MarR family transcriptional regulator
MMARDTTKQNNNGRLEQSPLHLLHRAEQCASEYFLNVASEGDITPRQYAVLTTIASHEGLSQTHLVERTGIDRSTVADITRRLLKRGLVQRRRTREDARAYAVKLTDAGWRALKSTEPMVKSVDEKILSVLPSNQRERFLEDLSAIVAALSVR